MICTTLGCLPAEADGIPWPNLADLLDYWMDNPPLHLMVKHRFGIKKQKEEAPVNMTPEQFMAMAKGAGL